MPRMVAPPPSGEYTVRLSKPFSGKLFSPSSAFEPIADSSGSPTHVVEVIGEPNRPGSVSVTKTTSDSSVNKKTGDIAAYVPHYPS